MKRTWRVLGCVVLLTLVIYGVFHGKSRLVYGIDGPYYLLQVESLQKTGTLRYGDPPLAFYTFYALSILLRDVVLGVKVGTVLAAVGVSIALFLLLEEVFRRWEIVAAGCTAAVVSPHLLRLSCDFLKNLMGSIFSILALFAFICAVRHQEYWEAIAALGCLLLAAVTHCLAFAIGLALVLLYGSVELVVRQERRPRVLRILLTTLLIPAAAALVGLLLFPTYFADVLKAEAFLEELLTGEGSLLPLMSPLSNTVFGISCAGVVLGWKQLQEQQETASFVLAVSLLGVGLTLPILPWGWAWRFSLMGFIPIAVVIAAFVYELRKQLLVVAVLAALLIPLTAQTAVGILVWGPCITETEYHDLIAMASYVSTNSVVASPLKHLRYWTEYLLHCSWAREPEPTLFQQYDHIFLLLHTTDIPPPSATLVYQGKALALYELRSPVGKPPLPPHR